MKWSIKVQTILQTQNSPGRPWQQSQDSHLSEELKLRYGKDKRLMEAGHAM